MQTIQIKNQFTAAVLFTYEVADDDPAPMRTALLAAARAGRAPKVLLAERAEILAHKVHASWTWLTNDQRQAKESLLAVIEREIAEPRSGSDLRGSDLSGSDLRGSDLRDSNLSGSDLSDSDLSDSDLSGSNLRDSNLRDSNLRDSNLRGSNLHGSDLSGSDLSGSDLRDSNLRDSNLRDSNLRDSNLRGSNLRGSDLRGSNNAPVDAARREPRPRVVTAEQHAERMRRAAKYRARWPHVPVVENLDAKILARIEENPEALQMDRWHSCDTTHCRSGWSIHLAGEAGYALESRFSSAHAGGLIYRVSTGRLPDFYASNEDAIADIRACAAHQTTPVEQPQQQ